MNPIPLKRIERAILLIRGERVMLDLDLAAVYGVATKALNQAVKRNESRFPSDFMFQLTEAEKSEVVTNCDHLAALISKAREGLAAPRSIAAACFTLFNTLLNKSFFIVQICLVPYVNGEV